MPCLTSCLGAGDESDVRLLAIAVVMCVGLACDEPSLPPASDPPATPAREDAKAPADVEPAPSEPAEPSEPPPPVGGPHCDQRETKQQCVDFTAHTGVTEVRCVEGGEPQQGPCPSEARVGSCVLPSTGVTLHYYEGKSLDAVRETCKAIDGQLVLP